MPPLCLLMIHHEETRLNANLNPNPNPNAKGGTKKLINMKAQY